MPNKITSQKIKEIALLGKVELSDKQAESLVGSVQMIISYMEELKTLDLDNVAETARVTEEINRFRSDEIRPSLTQEEALKNGKSHNGYFIVPYILGEESQ